MIDAGGDMMPVRARTQEEGRFPRRQILPRKGRHVALDRQFAGMVGQAGDLVRKAGLGRNVHEQVVNGGRPDDGQHVLPVGIGKG